MSLPNIVDPGNDPASLGWPVMLPFELAMRVASIPEICDSYGIGREEWNELRAKPAFQRAVARAAEELQKDDGLSFRIKARLQAEAMLPKVWEMVHASHEIVPPAVKKDLYMFTVKAAGLDASREQGVNAPVGTALQINLHLGSGLVQSATAVIPAQPTRTMDDEERGGEED